MARILIVDDEEAILEVLRIMLDREGHEVMMAHNASEAIAALESFAPEIAIVDLVMPGKGGLTLIMEHFAKRQSVAVIAMSGRIPVGADSMLGLGTTLRIGCFLPKPFTSEDVKAALHSAIAKSCA